MAKEISIVRKTMFYTGMLMVIGGFITFGLSVYNDATKTGYSNQGSQSVVLVVLGCMAAFVVGTVLIAIGRAGAAGAGLVLNPQQAREDLEPYSRMAGGMMKDAIDEAGLANAPLFSGQGQDATVQQEVVKIRCRGCAALNDEQAKFCNQCGAPL